jgi:hypothetical protein
MIISCGAVVLDFAVGDIAFVGYDAHELINTIIVVGKGTLLFASID